MEMDRENKRELRKKKWLWTGVLFGAAALLSMFKLVVLKEGGSVTYFSLLALWLITYFYGPKHGLLCSAAYGILRIFINAGTGEAITVGLDPNAAVGQLRQLFSGQTGWMTWIALILEYPLGYGVFCLGGFFRKNKLQKKSDNYNMEKSEIRDLRVGYLIGLLAQYALYVVSAMLFYPWDYENPIMNLGDCLLYEGSHLFVEGLLTIILLAVPVVVESITYVKYIATNVEENNVLETF